MGFEILIFLVLLACVAAGLLAVGVARGWLWKRETDPEEDKVRSRPGHDQVAGRDDPGGRPTHLRVEDGPQDRAEVTRR
jgi:hypothetical protein